RYNSTKPEKYHSEMEVRTLYRLMGGALESVSSVPAGNVFGIGNVKKHIVKTATISTHPLCSIFSVLNFAAPVVRVAVEPKNISEIGKLLDGLKLLHQVCCSYYFFVNTNQADPSIEVVIQETGEHVVV